MDEIIEPELFVIDDGANAYDPSNYIDIGPFFDRFGAAKLQVLMSSDATVQAILRDVQVRKWIDLKKPEVAVSIQYIATKVAAITPALQTIILSTSVLPEENMALRKLYFS